MQENIAPTKANLMAAQSALDFSIKGYELLDKKRNVLIREVMALMDRAQEIQQKAASIFQEAYEALQTANITLGITQVYEVAKSVKVPVIGMGGIASGDDAIEFILAGARAVMVGTANLVNPMACLDVIEGIEKYMDTYNFKRIDDIIGKVELY